MPFPSAASGRLPAGQGLPLLMLAVLAGIFFSLWPLPLQAAPPAPAVQDGQRAELRVLATTFPVYLFTRNVVRNRPYVRVELLIPAPAGCPHDYAPTPRDLQKLAQAHVLVMNGLGLEDFLTAPLKKIKAGVTVIDSSQGIDALPLMGAPASGHEGHGHNAMNPHIFAGPRQAAAMTYNIARGLARVDPEGASAYSAAAEDYAARLLSVGRRLSAVGADAPRKGIMLQHDGLAYLARDAGLDIVGVIQQGDDAQPSAARLIKLTRRIQEEKPVLIAGEIQYSDKAVLTLTRESGVPSTQLDTLASGPADAPLSYYEAVMTVNCQKLEKYFDPR